MADSQVQRVERILKDLRKVTAIFRLYGNDHPNTKQIAGRFVEALVPLLDDRGRLQLDVQADYLTLGDDVVYRDDETGSFAEILYREGIQQLTILPGVNQDELLDLVRLLSINLNLPGYEEETLISLLWQADLKHILYEAVQGLVEAVEQSETAAAGEMGAFSDVLSHILSTQENVSAVADTDRTGAPIRDQVSPAGRGRALSGEQALREAAHKAMKERERKVEDRPTTPFTQALQEAATVAGVSKPVSWSKEQQSAVVETIEWAEGYRGELQVPAEQVAEYWESLGSDTFESMLTSALEATLFLSARPVDGLSQSDAIELCRRGVTAALEANSIDPYLAAVGMLDRMTTASEFEGARGVLDELREEWTTPEILLKVCHGAHSSGNILQGLMAFVASGGESRVLAVRDLLSEITDEAQAWKVMDALNGAAEENPEILVDKIRNLSFEQLMAVYSCVARGDHPEFRRTLRLGLRHPKPEVRMHALTLVMGQPDETNAEAIAPLLQDRDNRVRLSALRSFQGIKLPELVPHLEPEMVPDTFKKKQDEEMALLAKAYGTSAQEAGIPTLDRILRFRRTGQILGKERPDIEAAMWGLLATKTDEGRLVVLRASKSWLAVLRKSAYKVMRESGILPAAGAEKVEEPVESAEAEP